MNQRKQEKEKRKTKAETQNQKSKCENIKNMKNENGKFDKNKKKKIINKARMEAINYYKEIKRKWKNIKE